MRIYVTSCQKIIRCHQTPVLYVPGHHRYDLSLVIYDYSTAITAALAATWVAARKVSNPSTLKETAGSFKSQ